MPFPFDQQQIAAHSQWSPRGFFQYPQWYPHTPPLAASAATDDFIEAWENPEPLDVPNDLTIVMVRGLFGSWIPGHFNAPLRTLQAAGLPSIIARTSATGSVTENAERLAREIAMRVPPQHRLLFLCHSKGGLDAQIMLSRHPDLRRRTAAVVLCQTPRDACTFLESVLLGRYRDTQRSRAQRCKEGILALLIRIAGARPACLDIGSTAIAAWVNTLDAKPLGVPTLALTSWSKSPTAWLDSQHARLMEIRPGCAHDGLFFVEDMVWPAAEQILLPHIDHAEPSVGSPTFDHGRFWLSLVHLALARCKANTVEAAKDAA